MATFGIYQVLDPLYVTPGGSVCSGKIVGGEAEGRIAVKVLNPPKPDPDEPNWEPKYFLDRAQVQRRVAATGGAHWGPIYALGFTPEGGAYYVTDYHALTAQKMIDGRIPLDATALHAIVRSVLSGLEEIRRIAGRAHANLKPANVLLIGNGAPGELRAVLSDPGQEYKAQKEGEAGDLHAVGALIHELVLNRRAATGQVPAGGDAGWERLGEKAESWRQLCADLLSHPIASRAATIAAAGKIVDGLAPHRLKVPHLRLPGKSKSKRVEPVKLPRAAKPARVRKPRAPSQWKRRMVQAVALVLLVGGTLGVLSVLEANAREELCVAREGWFGSLASSLAEPVRRERFDADPHLRRVAAGVDEIEQAGVQCSGGRPRILGFLEFQKSRAAAAMLRSIEQQLAPESWPRLSSLRALIPTFEKRGWQQPAGYTAQLLEGVRPRPTVSTALARPNTPTTPELPLAAAGRGTLAQCIDRVLRLQPIIEEQAASSEIDWKQLDERTASLQASQDPILHGFGALLRREAVSAVRLTDDGFEGLTQLKQSAGLSLQVLEALRTGPPGQVDTVRFASEVVRNMNPADLEIADVHRWLRERPRYVVRREQIAKAASELQKSYDTTTNEVSKSVPDEQEAAAFKLELESIEASLKDFRQTPFIERDITDGKFGGKVTEIREQIALLKRYYHADDAADWLKNLVGIATTSDRLKDAWNVWVTTLRSELPSMANDPALYGKNKARTDRLRDVLQQLELDFPQPPTDLTDAFAATARHRREQRLDAFVSAMDWTNPAVDADTVKAAADGIKAWFADLQALNQDFPVRKKLLTLDDRPDERWRRNESFWKDPLVQKLISGDVARIERLQKLRNASRKELVAAASDDAARKDVNLAAWQLLGDRRINPEWPASVDELAVEASLRGKVSAAIEPLDEAERKPLKEILDDEGPRRWRRFVESADDEAMLAAAIEWRKAFRIDGVVLADMDAAARFNVWLYLANLAIRDNNADGLQPVIDNISLAAKELEGKSEHQQKAAQVLEKLDRLKEPDTFAGRNIADVFALELAGLGEPIEFRRVEPSNGSRPFYLGTREVTLGQFAGAIEGKQLWPEARKLSWPFQPGKGDDPRRGPRVWEWIDAASPRLGPPQLWLTPDKRNDFPRELRGEKAKFNVNVLSPALGGMPSDQHPMQYISAQTALYYAAALGCRLPTSAEWHAALEASGKTVKNGNWNLRDQPWELFRAHATKFSITADNWPDRGAFPGDATPTPPPAPSRPGNDGAFLFRPAGSDDADAFADLIGNVAEYVCEVPEAFGRHTAAALPRKQTPEDIKRFLADTESGPGVVSVIAVIGGSALSAPDVPVDEPRPVKRTDRGFSDVGLRLAFTAPARNLAERLKWVLAGEQYVWPRTVSADTRAR